MRRLLLSASALLAAATAWADKYGMDEIEHGDGSSWGALALVVALFAYLYFKEK